MFSERIKCIFCNSYELKTYFKKNFMIPQSACMTNTIIKGELMPYNIQICSTCKTFQNKYLANLDILYCKDLIINPYGNIRKNCVKTFYEFIKNDNMNISGIIEIGGGSGELYKMFKNEIPYIIIDPSSNIDLGDKLIKKFIEDIDLNNFDQKYNTLIMSHVFEHFYEPKKILNIISKCFNIKYIYICHPNFDTYVKKDPNQYYLLHCEHTFYIENDFLVKLFNNISFELIKSEEIDDYSLNFKFERKENLKRIEEINLNSENIMNIYHEKIFNKIKYFNELLEQNNDFYIWPCSFHNIVLFNFGLNYKKLKGILDNSETKIGKYMYGFNIKCESFNKIINNTDDNKIIYIILNGGVFNKEIINKYNYVKNIIFIL